MAKFNEYPSKATPEDADTLMLYDAAAKSNKLSPFSGIWNWIVGKLTNAVISNLQTNNKTVLGAINELNSNTFPTVYGSDYPEKNFNKIIQSGWYTYGSVPTSIGLSNCPSESTGSLCVIRLTYLQIQFWFDTSNSLYFRSRYPSYDWGEWFCIK